MDLGASSQLPWATHENKLTADEKTRTYIQYLFEWKCEEYAYKRFKCQSVTVEPPLTDVCVSVCVCLCFIRLYLQLGMEGGGGEDVRMPPRS